MTSLYIKNKRITAEHIQDKSLPIGEYESCTFINCNFSNADLSNFIFSDCSFEGCNLSLVKLQKTALRNVIFKDTKISGVQFEQCNEFGLSFTCTHCMIHNASFFNMHMRSTIFKNCEIRETDFSECDLRDSIFEYCDLIGSTFNQTNLQKTDFRTSYNYSIDPNKNKIKKAKFGMSGIIGLLGTYDIEVDTNI